MDKTQIESEYQVENGIIRSPGKFEGEPVYAPYFWDILLQGMADDENEHNEAVFNITDEDRALFPELLGISKLYVFESDQGFIYTRSE